MNNGNMTSRLFLYTSGKHMHRVGYCMSFPAADDIMTPAETVHTSSSYQERINHILNKNIIPQIISLSIYCQRFTFKRPSDHAV